MSVFQQEITHHTRNQEDDKLNNNNFKKDTTIIRTEMLDSSDRNVNTAMIKMLHEQQQSHLKQILKMGSLRKEI